MGFNFKDNGGLVDFRTGNLLIINCYFSEINFQNSSNLFFLENSNIEIQNTTMNNFLTENSNVSYLLNINQGELTIKNSIFQNFYSMALFFIDKGSHNQIENYNLSIYGCTFLNMTLEKADFIFINESFNFVKIFESKFKHLSSQNILINSMSVQNQIEFRSVKFIENWWNIVNWQEVEKRFAE